jgi:hypothetical protein
MNKIHRVLWSRRTGQYVVVAETAKTRGKGSTLFDFHEQKLLRGCLYHQNALTFQFESGAVTDGGELVTRDIEDRGFPLGHILIARLAKRQLPVIAHAFAQHVLSRLERPAD